MPAGIFFVVIGGWLLSRWTYSSSAFGLVNGRYVFWLRLNVTSRKLIICLLASMVMRSPFFAVKDAAYFFLDVFCISGGGVSNGQSVVSV